MKEWVCEVIAPYAKKLREGKRGLFIMDNHSTHIDPEVKNKITSFRYDISFLPPNCTSRLQPLDLGINKPFKDYYSEMWQDWFEDLVNKHNNKGKFESPSKELIVTWI